MKKKGSLAEMVRQIKFWSNKKRPTFKRRSYGFFFLSLEARKETLGLFSLYEQIELPR